MARGVTQGFDEAFIAIHESFSYGMKGMQLDWRIPEFQ